MHLLPALFRSYNFVVLITLPMVLGGINHIQPIDSLVRSPNYFLKSQHGNGFVNILILTAIATTSFENRIIVCSLDIVSVVARSLFRPLLRLGSTGGGLVLAPWRRGGQWPNKFVTAYPSNFGWPLISSSRVSAGEVELPSHTLCLLSCLKH